MSEQVKGRVDDRKSNGVKEGSKSRLVAKEVPSEEGARYAPQHRKGPSAAWQRESRLLADREKVQRVTEDGEHRGVLQSYRCQRDAYDTRKPDSGPLRGYFRMSRASAAMAEHYPYADGRREIGSDNEPDPGEETSSRARSPLAVRVQDQTMRFSLQRFVAMANHPACRSP